MSFEQAIPVLPARDVAAMVAFYREALGFTDGFVYGEDEYGVVSQGALEFGVLDVSGYLVWVFQPGADEDLVR